MTRRYDCHRWTAGTRVCTVVASAVLAETTSAEENQVRRADLLKLGKTSGQTRPVGPHDKACGGLPATSRRTTSTARSCYSAGYTALRHQPTNCCSDLHESGPSPKTRPTRLPRRQSWSDTNDPQRSWHYIRSTIGVRTPISLASRQLAVIRYILTVELQQVQNSGSPDITVGQGRCGMRGF